MSAYGWAWVVIGGAAVLGSLALSRLTLRLRGSPVRWLLQSLVLVWFLLPAPVPGHGGQWAPAFVVLIFESVFQRNGQPVPAALILLAGSLVTLVLVIWLGLRRHRGRSAGRASSRESAPAGEEASAAEPSPGGQGNKVADPN